MKNIHFPEVINYSRGRARAVRQGALSKLVEYAPSHGVKYFVVEKLSRPDKLRGKVGRWSVREYQRQIEMLVRRAGGVLIKVDPAFTSIDATGIMLARRIDVHTASAYLIALRGTKDAKWYRKL